MTDRSIETEMRLDGDILHIRVVGQVDVAEMQRMMAFGDGLAEKYGYILMLADAQHSTGISADARKLQSDRLKRVIYPSHTAIFGASTVIRLVSNLVQKGIELVSGNTYPVSFHRSEAEAMATLVAQRELLRAAKPRGQGG